MQLSVHSNQHAAAAGKRAWVEKKLWRQILVSHVQSCIGFKITLE
jgi:hypothetical protein